MSIEFELLLEGVKEFLNELTCPISSDGVENCNFAFAILAHQNDISLSELKELNGNNRRFYCNTRIRVNEQISFHYVSPSIMVSVFLKSISLKHHAASMLSRLSRFVRNRLHKWKNFGRSKGK